MSPLKSWLLIGLAFAVLYAIVWIMDQLLDEVD